MSRIRKANTTRSAQPCVLTIAGSDSGAGAGIQADSRTIQALGGFAATAITAITAQNTRGVQKWQAVSPRLVGEQIESVLSDLPVAAIKTGLLPGSGTIRAIATALAGAPVGVPLVLDPILSSSSGTRFLDDRGVATFLKFLAPRASLLTPNWPEAAKLARQNVATPMDAERAGRGILHRTGCQAVLVKGGHGTGPFSEDILILRSGEVHRFCRRRIQTANTHGTGCVLAAAIATELARGANMLTAVEKAGDFLHAALLRGRTTRFGVGRGPALLNAEIRSPSR